MAVSGRSKAQVTLNIENEQQPYGPGCTLRGHVQLVLSGDCAIGNVAVKLLGYTKSKIVRSNGQFESVFRGHSVVFKIEKILHDGHYTHKKGTIRWPFEIRIPDEAHTRSSSERWRAQEGFRSSKEDNDPQLLPPSFYFAESSAGQGFYASVTYALEAAFTQPGRNMEQLPPYQRCVTVLNMLPRPTNEPIDLDDPRNRRGVWKRYTVRSFKLLPEGAESLSILQKVKSVISSTSLPKFTCDVDISYPTILQAYHLRHLPFVISAVPKTEAQWTSIQPNLVSFYRYPSLVIRHVKIWLQATTSCRCRSVISDACASSTHDIVLADCRFDNLRLAMRSLAWDQKVGRDEDIPATVDLGRECVIHITTDSRGGPQHLDTQKNPNTRPETKVLISPSFSTYNISRKYQLLWHIEAECAGEKLTIKDKSAEEVTVIGPPFTVLGEIVQESGMFQPSRLSDEGGSDDENDLNQHSGEDLPPYRESSRVVSA